MTEKLFYQDSHMKEFQATVVSCEPQKGHYLIELDQTAFSRKAEDSMQIPGRLVMRKLRMYMKRMV